MTWNAQRFTIDAERHEITVYGPGLFQREDFERPKDPLAGVEGNFLLSLNEVPEVRGLSRAFSIEPVTTRYTCMRAGNQQAAEVPTRNC